MAFRQKKVSGHEKDASESIIHRFKANPLVFIGTILILIIVIVAFVLVPAIVPEYGRGGGADLTFGSYDKVPITYVQGNYFAQYQQQVAHYRQQYDPDNFQYAGFQIWEEAFKAAAVHTAILHEMKQAQYAIPARVVDREVAQLPQFQENGRFSSALYQRLSSNDRLTLWRQMQDDLIKRLFISDITGVLKSSAEGKFIGKMASPQRTFQMVSFSVDAYPDSEYTAYAEEHPELFRVTHLSKITVNSGEREARQLLNSIKDGTAAFEDAARTQSQDSYAERGGDMGIKLAHELIQEAPEEGDREKLLALGAGEYSDVVKLESGWAFFRAEEAVRDVDTSDPTVLEKVRSYVRNFERGRMENRALENAREFIALVQSSDFDDAAYQQRLEKRNFGPLPINYGDVDLFTSLRFFSVPELANAASNENFWKIAFSTPINTPSEPLVQGGNVLVLFPTDETEAEESSIDAIASTYSDYWLSYMTEQSISTYFLNNPKMDNRFFQTYFRYFLPQSE
jgi:hypothetical protein